MTRSFHRWSSVLLLLASVGCNQCGDRPRLLGRLRDTDTADRRGVDRFRQVVPGGCNDALPPPRPAGNGFDAFGQPVSRSGGRFVSPLSGVPYSNPLPGGGFPASPSYPYGNPITIGPPPTRDDQLPPPGSFNTIPPTSVPAIPRATEGTKLFPPLVGGIVTGDPKK